MLELLRRLQPYALSTSQNTEIYQKTYAQQDLVILIDDSFCVRCATTYWNHVLCPPQADSWTCEKPPKKIRQSSLIDTGGEKRRLCTLNGNVWSSILRCSKGYLLFALKLRKTIAMELRLTLLVANEGTTRNHK